MQKHLLVRLKDILKAQQFWIASHESKLISDCRFFKASIVAFWVVPSVVEMLTIAHSNSTIPKVGNITYTNW